MTNNWTKEEHILAFNLYCKIPFSKINANYPPVKGVAYISREGYKFGRSFYNTPRIIDRRL